MHKRAYYAFCDCVYSDQSRKEAASVIVCRRGRRRTSSNDSTQSESTNFLRSCAFVNATGIISTAGKLVKMMFDNTEYAGGIKVRHVLRLKSNI